MEPFLTISTVMEMNSCLILNTATGKRWHLVNLVFTAHWWCAMTLLIHSLVSIKISPILSPDLGQYLYYLVVLVIYTMQNLFLVLSWLLLGKETTECININTCNFTLYSMATDLWLHTRDSENLATAQFMTLGALKIPNQCWGLWCSLQM